MWSVSEQKPDALVLLKWHHEAPQGQREDGNSDPVLPPVCDEKKQANTKNYDHVPAMSED